MSAGMDGRVRSADVVVIGAGQAGLSAAYHLHRRGFLPAGTALEARNPAGPVRSYIVLDAEDGPGGAWRHRWKSLLMATVNGISDLPGIPQPAVDPEEASSSFLARYFGGYEQQLGLAIERPVKVRSVAAEDHDAGGRLRIATSGGDWSARAVINATGTWTRPFWPDLPGPGVLPRTAAARCGLRLGGGVPRPARGGGGRGHLRRRAAGRDFPGHHHQLVHPPEPAGGTPRSTGQARARRRRPSSRSACGRVCRRKASSPSRA